MAEEPPFTHEEVARARAYHRPRYRAEVADTVLSLLLLGLLAFSPVGAGLYRAVAPLPWWGAALGFAALVAAAGWLVDLPLAFWRGHVHERRWGFSTQTAVAWLGDQAKALGVGLVLAALAFLGLAAAARAMPTAWPALVAPAAAALIALLSFVAPVVLEPIFNRFRPLEDRALAEDLLALATRVGVPVRDVLVADASRRSTKGNAYVSGLGATRRVVVFDTLLDQQDPGALRVVVAHELGHRRMHHVAWGTLIAMAGAAGFVVVLWSLLSWAPARAAAGLGGAGAGDPRAIPFVLFLAGGLGLLARPLAAARSRRRESDADRFALRATADPAAYERTFRSLGVANLIDLDPPRFAYLVLFGHPTPPQRIAAGRRWASELGLSPAPTPPTTG